MASNTSLPVVTLYSPVGDNGFESQQPQHSPQQDPEDFYRSTPGKLDTNNTGDHHDHAVSPISPADSQAPIMGVGQAQEYPPPPTMAAYSPPRTVEGEYPLPPTVFSSAGVVNGEIGAVYASPTPPPQARQDPYAGATMPMTPLTPAPKTPTFREESNVDKYDQKVQRYDKRDLAVKLRVRLAKILLRGINCACSTVVLALLVSTFVIFNASKNLAPRNNLPPWAILTPQWPQITVLCIAVLSLAVSLYIMYGYWRGGHKRAEKIAVYWTVAAVVTFIFTILLWAFAAGVMQVSRNTSQGQDIWGWACKDNNRRKLFQDDINYKLVCRQQDWVLVCAIIEITVETITIAIYGFTFWRLASKRKLRKSMDIRDKARNELWLAKLREQQTAEANEPKLPDEETDANTAYNKLNGTTVYASSPDAEEGRAPIMLQRPPRGNYATAPHKAVNISPPGSAGDRVPPTPRSVSFQAPLTGTYPPPPMSASFPRRSPPNSSGSDK